MLKSIENKSNLISALSKKVRLFFDKA